MLFPCSTSNQTKIHLVKPEIYEKWNQTKAATKTTTTTVKTCGPTHVVIYRQLEENKMMCGIESENTTVCVNHTGNAYNNNDIMYLHETTKQRNPLCTARAFSR